MAMLEMDQVDRPIADLVLLDDPHGMRPIRAEVFGHERLENHARFIGERMKAVRVEPGQPLISRFLKNSHQLQRAYRTICDAYRAHEPLGHDAEWLLDNYHIINDTLVEVRTDLPYGYYRWLPKISQGLLKGFPRVYALALELTAHCDSLFDEANITRFIQAFQEKTPLTVGELWAVPIMLRMCLLDNLNRLAEQVVRQRRHRRQALDWVNANMAELETSFGHDPFGLNLVEADWRDCYVLHMLEGVHEHESIHPQASDRIRQHLGQSGNAASDVLRREKERQAANQVSIGNCVTSLRLLSTLDWSRFFERASSLEARLRNDPAGVYGKQDFATRDRYRRIVEHLARRTSRSELDIADVLMQLAGGQHAGDASRRHIGFFLIDEGRSELEARIGYRAPPSQWLRRLLLIRPELSYFGALFGFSIAIAAALAWGCVALGTLPALAALLLAAAFVPITELAVGLVNFLVPALLNPRSLARLDFDSGIPEDCATFVVIPSLLATPENASHLVEQLEIHYLSNPEDRLFFGLLTDFADAPAETMPGDAACLQAVEAGIRDLNERYADAEHPRFFLFHRRRLWNPVQNCWMGWERKRGKLAEFNRLLQTNDPGNFTTVGDPLKLPRARFVITLDADTQMPRESARKLIATMAHPLNRPVFDPGQGRVVRGYGILQPRVSLSLRGAGRSLFARIFTGSAGLDPYTTAVSDTYQDLFGSGSFTGKGIYDVAAFEAATGHRFPDNRILSHDLIEGNFARCGFVSNVELLDDFPTHYQSYSRREHRWVRGDWQVMSWLFRRAPACNGGSSTNTLPLLERWKILDNLRRSLVAPSLVALLIIGWALSPSAWAPTIAAALVIAWPLVLNLLAWPFRVARQLAMGNLRLPAVSNLGPTAAQAFFSAAALLDQARSMIDAVARTFYRLIVSRKRLLEWETAAETERRLKNSLSNCIRIMGTTALAALAIAVFLLVVRPDALPAACPFLLGWFLSPLAAWWMGKQRPFREPELTNDERALLRRWACTTWSFFETFVGEEDHWLPPDNYQEEPKGQVAHRTSPTNIGLYLVSCVAAHDLGYLSWPDLLERLEKTMETLRSMERAQGHFYNWYDTRDLSALRPIYLSTVDSGNMAASLMTLKQLLLERTNCRPWGSAVRDGLADVLRLAEESLKSSARRLSSLHALLSQMPEQADEWPTWIDKIAVESAALSDETARSKEPDQARHWTARLANLAKARCDELKSDEAANNDRAGRLAREAENLADSMDFRLLYNFERDLFAVGFNLSAGKIDSAHYDLLASESCLTSFLAVARGDVPRKHWFHLGRPLTRAAGSPTLLSWGGTMFEYLMPRLFLPVYPDTLLDESQHAAVRAQIEYGREYGKPWGISESAYSAVDADWNYQYQAFGAPGLGLKRGLGQELVVAPYAGGLAVMVAAGQAVKNYRRLVREGAEGRYGMYEAIDYTADRLPQSKSSVVVKCFMAHHQGMTLLALTNRLLDNPIPRAFRAEPMVRATELLLQERVPREVPLEQPQARIAAFERSFQEPALQLSRRITTPHTGNPRTHLLASERCSLMITNAGSGQTRARGIAVTRWREDGCCDAYGQFIYVRDLRSGRYWSAGYQPVCREADEFEATFATDKVTFRRLDGLLETQLEVTISPENHAEVRRITFTNHDSHSHYLEVTSYAELALTTQAADLAHPAFEKLFLETEFVSSSETLLCHRRQRSPEDKPVWALHVLTSEGQTFGNVQFETDRARFIGRGRTLASPAALDAENQLSGTTGPVLDAVFSLRRRIRVRSNTSVSLTFTTAVAESRDEAVRLADHYHDEHNIRRAFEFAWAHAQVELRQYHLTAGEIHLFQRLAAHVIYASPTLRAGSNRIAANRQGQSALWRHGVSGDLPIVLVFVTRTDDLSFTRQVIGAHALWRRKGLAADLVIVNEQDGGYLEEFQQQLIALVRSSDDRDLVDKPGGVYLRKATHLSLEDRALFQAVARCVLVSGEGSLAAQLDRKERQAAGDKKLIRSKGAERPEKNQPPAPAAVETLTCDNGLGGFTPDGKEYVIRLTAPDGVYVLPPQPWINVIANPNFGTIVSESGGGCTWSGNSQSNRLTPWRNDPVSDGPSEAIYLRDPRSGELWTATPLPPGAPAEFRVRHGHGWTLFNQSRNGLEHELSIFVPVNQPMKVMRLVLRNSGNRACTLTVAYFAEWVLGRTREQAAMHVVTEVDPDTGTLLARSALRPDYSDRVAFADVSLRPRTFTGDRTEFLGRNGNWARPVGLDRGTLSGTVGAGLDPCAVLQASLTVPANGNAEVVFVLGDAPDAAEAGKLAQQCRDAAWMQAAWQAVDSFWTESLNRVAIQTPNRALDLLFNQRLLYQVLACRMWARSALYQSSGAFGFRDQLQDSLALVYSVPEEARRHILRAASRQFVEGDVQHWWHPPSGAGVRTRFSDDYLWLPFTVEHFIRVTGDRALLDETAPYLQAPLLKPGQDEDYRVPNQSDSSGSIYEHCTRAIERAFHYGVNGLPLMGTGDWNDGMNRVGNQGHGESVWTGWFLIAVARAFAAICEARGDSERAERYRAEAEAIRENLEKNAWDGEWYRRAFFDDGQLLGSKDNGECRIDSIVQTWAVICEQAEPARARQAMAEVDRQLIRHDDKLVLLFAPPFDHGPLHPGYIKGYVPGIRENGGQYTHAAVWVAQAFALLGESKKAVEVLDMLNPILHAVTAEGAARFKVEPYAVPGDVYGGPPHVGRGGWSWYTGSAGWFYRVILEVLLGFEKRGDTLFLNPRVPPEWADFEINYLFGSTRYRIKARRTSAAAQSTGPKPQEVHLVDDGQEHEIAIEL